MQALMYAGCHVRYKVVPTVLAVTGSYEELQLARQELSVHSSVLNVNSALKNPRQHRSTEALLQQLLDPCAEQHDAAEYATSQPAEAMHGRSAIYRLALPSSCMPSCANAAPPTTVQSSRQVRN